MRHNPKSTSATKALHDRFQSYSMEPWQNPLVALTALEMASQLSQKKKTMSPNQLLIQCISIITESEYEVENKTFCNGLKPDREPILMAIRSRFENLQRQCKKGGEGRTPGMLSWSTLEEGLARNIIPRQAPAVVERNEGVVVGDGVGITMKRRKNNTRRPVAWLVGEKPTTPRATARGVSAAAAQIHPLP